MNAPELLPAIAAEPGIYYGMPAEQYHRVEAMSASGAKKMLRSPQHYKLMRDTPSEPTDAMQFGTAVHAGVLEPDTFAQVVICEPSDAPRRPTSAQLRAKKPSPETIDAIAFWQEFNRASIGKIVLSAEDHARALNCIAAVRAHPAAQKLLDGAAIETSVFWRDGRYGVPCKSRRDIVSHGGISDLKTCADASPEAFARSIATFLYHCQAAAYFSGHEHVCNETPRFFCLIAVESDPPHGVAVYSLPSNAILAGAHLWNIALERYAEALASGQYPGYPQTIETITLPKWATTFNAY